MVKEVRNTEKKLKKKKRIQNENENERRKTILLEKAMDKFIDKKEQKLDNVDKEQKLDKVKKLISGHKIKKFIMNANDKNNSDDKTEQAEYNQTAEDIATQKQTNFNTMLQLIEELKDQPKNKWASSLGEKGKKCVI